MKFLFSAIKLTPKNGSQMIVYGKRHCDCLEQIYKMRINHGLILEILTFILKRVS